MRRMLIEHGHALSHRQAYGPWSVLAQIWLLTFLPRSHSLSSRLSVDYRTILIARPGTCSRHSHNGENTKSIRIEGPCASDDTRCSWSVLFCVWFHRPISWNCRYGSLKEQARRQPSAKRQHLKSHGKSSIFHANRSSIVMKKPWKAHGHAKSHEGEANKVKEIETGVVILGPYCERCLWLPEGCFDRSVFFFRILMVTKKHKYLGFLEDWGRTILCD